MSKKKKEKALTPADVAAFFQVPAQRLSEIKGTYTGPPKGRTGTFLDGIIEEELIRAGKDPGNCEWYISGINDFKETDETEFEINVKKD
jgi:hypothetical protein